MKVHHRRTSSEMLWQVEKPNKQKIKILKPPEQNHEFFKFIHESNKKKKVKTLNVEFLNPSFQRQNSMFLFGANRERVHSQQPTVYLETIKERRTVQKITYKKNLSASSQTFYKNDEKKQKKVKLSDFSFRSPYICGLEKNQPKAVKKKNTQERKEKNKDFFSKTFINIKPNKLIKKLD